MKTKSALSYFGSDSEVAPQIAKLLDHCRHVTIPFVGGASILPYLKARAIVANDLHDAAICFYRVMSNPKLRPALIDYCQRTLSHPATMKAAMDTARASLQDGCFTDLHRAWAMWAICWVGRKGKGGTRHAGGLPSVRRTADGGTNASRLRAAADDLAAWAKHFERCEWESVCFRELLPKVADRANCGVYCDPPWVGAGRNYLHAFSPEDHSELEALLRRFTKTTVVVRYDDCATVRDLYSNRQWCIRSASSRDQCNAVKGEVWITNTV